MIRLQFKNNKKNYYLAKRTFHKYKIKIRNKIKIKYIDKIFFQRLNKHKINFLKI